MGANTVRPLDTRDEVCGACQNGDCQECASLPGGRWDDFTCQCESCLFERQERNEIEFYNGLEDFFKSIDPDRLGWETIEAEVRENLPCPVCGHLLRSHGDGDGCGICGVWCGAEEHTSKWEAFDARVDAGDLVS